MTIRKAIYLKGILLLYDESGNDKEAGDRSKISERR